MSIIKNQKQKRMDVNNTHPLSKFIFQHILKYVQRALLPTGIVAVKRLVRQHLIYMMLYSDRFGLRNTLYCETYED